MAETLHILFTRAIPELEEPQELLFIEAEGSAPFVDVGSEESSGDIEFPAADEFEYATTVVATYASVELLGDTVHTWWRSETGASARLEMIADDASLMSEDEIARLRELPEDAWSFNPVFVACRIVSPESRAAVIDFLKKSSLTSH